MTTVTPTRVAPITKGDPRYGNNGHDFEECEHLVTDIDPDTALCGVDQTNVPWDQGLPFCEACLAISEGRMN